MATAKCCPRLASENREVLGYMFTRISSVLNTVTFLTLAPALLVLAQRDAGCYSVLEEDDVRNWYCPSEDANVADKTCRTADACRVNGMSPSSVIPLIGTITGLLNALIMPFVGAGVDYSSKRWEIVCASGTVLVLSNFMQIFLFIETWYLMTIIQATVGSAAYLSQQVCVTAYVPELSDDQAQIPAITGAAKAWEGISIILFIAVATGAGGGTGPGGSIQNARIAQALVVVVTGPLMAAGVRRLGPRPALHELPAGESVALVGFKQVAATTRKLRTEFGTLGRFFAAYTFWQSATLAILSLAPSYMLDQLSMEPAHMTVAVVLFMIFSIPGAMFSTKVAQKKWLSAQTSIAVAIVLLSVGMILACLFIYTPEMRMAFFAIMPLMGFGQGWIYPAQRNVLFALVPGGCEAEMMGFYEFLGALLSWAPPLMFLIMSEATGSLRWAILALPLFWLVGLAILRLTVDVDKGIAEAASTLHLRAHGTTAKVHQSKNEVELTKAQPESVEGGPPEPDDA